MSLPTTAQLYLGNKPVGAISINVGWFYRDDLVPEAFRKSLGFHINTPIPTFDRVYVYGKWWNVVDYGIEVDQYASQHLQTDQMNQIPFQYGSSIE